MIFILYKFQFIYIILILFTHLKCDSIISPINLVQLSSEEIFIIRNDGIYIYNSNLENSSTIYNFKDSQIINAKNNINNILISNFVCDNNKYLICLVNRFLYVYNTTNGNKYIGKINDLPEEENSDGKITQYNLIPYKIENNILFFIISLIKVPWMGHKILFLYYEFNFLDNIIKKKNENYFNEGNKFNSISEYLLSCHSYFSFKNIICFYHEDYYAKLRAFRFSLLDNPNDIKKNIYLRDYVYPIKIIDSVISKSDIIFICVLLENKKTECFYYVDKTQSFSYILYLSCQDIKTYYFGKENEFALLCKDIQNIYVMKINYDDKNDNSQYLFQFDNPNCLNSYFLIYDSIDDKYCIINNCFEIKCSFEKLEEPVFTLENIDFNITADQLKDNLGLIINSAQIGENYFLEGNRFNLKISPTNSSFFDNSTHVVFDKCEKILREKYNISNSSILTLFQLELENNNSQSLINQVEYFIVTEDKVILNLTACKNVSIEIKYSMKEGIIDISDISVFLDSGIDVFNINDPFFTDLCYSFTNTNDDIILEDRVKYIYQNYSVCDSGCTLNKENTKSTTISCDCKVKENINTTINPLNIQKEIESYDSNIFVLKCYNLVFSFNGKFKNIGFWLILVLLFANIIFLILYFINGIKPILKYIFNKMVNNGYLEKNSKMFFNEQNKIESVDVQKEKKIKRKKRKKKTSNPIKKVKKHNRYDNKNLSPNNSNRIINLKMNKGDNSFSAQKIKPNNKNALNELITNKNKISIKPKAIYRNKKHKMNTNHTTDGYKNKDKEDSDNFGIMKIDLNNIENYIPPDSYQTLHNYTFEEAMEYDKRSIFKIFYIYLLSKQIIFHTFLQKNPLELIWLRICLFIFMLSTDLALNSLLYLKDNISKKYHYASNLFLFTFTNNITIILLSTLISFIIMSLISKLNNSTNEIRKVFGEYEEKIKKEKKYKINEKDKITIFQKVEKILKILKIKILIFIIIELLLILFYWYFITAFCHVFPNTQFSWLLDTFLSILSRIIIELLFALLFSKLYIISVESNFYSLYRVLLFIYDFS